jgi:hypothetical protein
MSPLFFAALLPVLGHSIHGSLRLQPTARDVHAGHGTDARASALVAVAESASPPMPPHLIGIALLSVLYFSAFVLIVVARAATLVRALISNGDYTIDLGRVPLQAERGPPVSLHGKLERASDVLFYIPALTIIFLAARVWSIHAHDGDLTPWVVYAMKVIAVAIFIQYVLKVFEPDESSFALAMIFKGLGALAGACVHFGTLVIVVTILTSPYHPSIAMQCLSLLVAVYFTIHTALAVHSTFVAFTGTTQEVYGTRKARTKTYAQVRHVMETLGLFPMLCILLITTRMRAIELSVESSTLTENGMLALAFGASLQVLIVIAESLFGRASKDFLESSTGRTLRTLLSLLEIVCLLTVYAGVVIVFVEVLDWTVGNQVSLLTVTTSAKGPLPVSMKCVTMLSVLYFLAYFSVLAARVYQYISFVLYARDDFTKGHVEDVMESACKAVVFVPMMCMLMIALRLRAQTLGRDDPEHWVQMAMLTTAISLCVQVCLAPVISLMVGPSDRPGREESKYIAIALMTFDYLIQLVVYVALAALLFALWV